VSGTVIDSLHDRPLAGATVVVDGTNATTVSDSLGRYRLTDVPAGTHQVAIYHPLLDTLGIGLYTPALSIPGGVETVVPFALPSATTLIARFCPADTSAHTLIVGQVLDADRGTPVANATVTSSGQAMLLAPGNVLLPLGAISHVAKTDAGGRFHYCMTRGRHFLATATLGNSSTGEIPLDLVNGVALPVLYVARADSAKQADRGTLSGRVVTSDGQPIEGATVSISAGRGNAKTTSDGVFAMKTAPVGTQVLTVRRVGFAELDMPVVVSATSTAAVTATLLPKVATLATVEISRPALTAAYERTGFQQRQKSGMGHYLTSDQIQSRGGTSATSLMQGMPGVLLVFTRSGGARVVSARDGALRRRNCTAFYVDGTFVPRGSNGSDDETLPVASEIIGIEVYQSDEPIPGFVPSRCLTVLIWTRAQLAGG
jgi:Carboxypeptidase regulatory-like domain/TonB-dependent Receptor Plug Domain